MAAGTTPTCTGDRVCVARHHGLRERRRSGDGAESRSWSGARDAAAAGIGRADGRRRKSTKRGGNHHVRPVRRAGEWHSALDRSTRSPSRRARPLQRAHRRDVPAAAGDLQQRTGPMAWHRIRGPADAAHDAGRCALRTAGGGCRNARRQAALVLRPDRTGWKVADRRQRRCRTAD